MLTGASGLTKMTLKSCGLRRSSSCAAPRRMGALRTCCGARRGQGRLPEGSWICKGRARALTPMNVAGMGITCSSLLRCPNPTQMAQGAIALKTPRLLILMTMVLVPVSNRLMTLHPPQLTTEPHCGHCRVQRWLSPRPHPVIARTRHSLQQVTRLRPPAELRSTPWRRTCAARRSRAMRQRCVPRPEASWLPPRKMARCGRLCKRAARSCQSTGTTRKPCVPRSPTCWRALRKTALLSVPYLRACSGLPTICQTARACSRRRLEALGTPRQRMRPRPPALPTSCSGRCAMRLGTCWPKPRRMAISTEC
mmetsp:Transcript_84396/g.243609  ORF Transcript_84396/g.243609 Transcript_84396/m.243609 type:complete len:309 (-) Transcript_84396:2880-3806(-)